MTRIKGKKLDDKAFLGISVGIDEIKKGFLVIPDGMRKPILSKDVTFNEQKAAMNQGRQHEIDIWEQKISELQTFSFQKEKTEDSKMEQEEQEPNQDVKLSDANAGNVLSKLDVPTVRRSPRLAVSVSKVEDSECLVGNFENGTMEECY